MDDRFENLTGQSVKLARFVPTGIGEVSSHESPVKFVGGKGGEGGFQTRQGRRYLLFVVIDPPVEGVRLSRKSRRPQAGYIRLAGHDLGLAQGDHHHDRLVVIERLRLGKGVLKTGNIL